MGAKNNLEEPKMHSSVIPVFFAVDDNYAPFLGVAIHSLLQNASKNYIYNIHILTEGLSQKNTARLTAYGGGNANVRIENVSDRLKVLEDKIHLRDYYTKATYYRFLIADMFPEYKKGLYLDCDIVVNGDISALFGCELGNNLVAAMPEEVMLEYDVYGTYVEKVLGIDRNVYFNAGVLVLNLEMFRQTDIISNLFALMEKYTFSVTQDEDYLNVLCHGSTLLLPQHWNKNAFPACESVTDPAKLVHYKINWKPWHYDGVGYEKDFWRYAALTEYFEDIRAIKDGYSQSDMARDAFQFEQLALLAERETAKAEKTGYVLPLKYTVKTPAEV